ncbi:hypothetical protein LZ30DRAFT_690192 [Colletotrichum cereale]|nr:hypothetical protein LZ30DRAFT_690192 [Colletotrichum cereale]
MLASRKEGKREIAHRLPPVEAIETKTRHGSYLGPPHELDARPRHRLRMVNDVSRKVWSEPPSSSPLSRERGGRERRCGVFVGWAVASARVDVIGCQRRSNQEIPCGDHDLTLVEPLCNAVGDDDDAATGSLQPGQDRLAI